MQRVSPQTTIVMCLLMLAALSLPGAAQSSTAGASVGVAFDISPLSQSVTTGNSTNYTVTVTPAAGFSGDVTLAATGLPKGAKASFSPNPVTVGSEPVSSTLTITTTSS